MAGVTASRDSASEQGNVWSVSKSESYREIVSREASKAADKVERVGFGPVGTAGDVGVKRLERLHHDAAVLAGHSVGRLSQVQRAIVGAAPELEELRRHAERSAEIMQSLGRAELQRRQQRWEVGPRRQLLGLQSSIGVHVRRVGAGDSRLRQRLFGRGETTFKVLLQQVERASAVAHPLVIGMRCNADNTTA